MRHFPGNEESRLNAHDGIKAGPASGVRCDNA